MANTIKRLIESAEKARYGKIYDAAYKAVTKLNRGEVTLFNALQIINGDYTTNDDLVDLAVLASIGNRAICMLPIGDTNYIFIMANIEATMVGLDRIMEYRRLMVSISFASYLSNNYSKIYEIGNDDKMAELLSNDTINEDNLIDYISKEIHVKCSDTLDKATTAQLVGICATLYPIIEQMSSIEFLDLTKSTRGEIEMIPYERWHKTEWWEGGRNVNER